MATEYVILLFAVYYVHDRYIVHSVYSDIQICPPLISVLQEIRFSKPNLLVPVVPCV